MSWRIVSILNFVLLNISMVLFSITSIISVIPVTLEAKYRKKSWKICTNLRIVMSIFAVIMILNMIFWIWIPLDEISWVIFSRHWISIIIGVAIILPCSVMLFFALKHGGKEHMAALEETTLHKGIYNYIRHPGIIGEMPIFVAIAFCTNSLFLVVWSIVFIVIYTPIYIYFEEMDLVKRFGEEYINYRENTGALIPKRKKKERL